MTTDVREEVEEEVAQRAPTGGRTRPIFGYYRKVDGDITVDVTSPMERLAYLEEGWQFLSAYGTFDATTEYAANHPFEALFMFGGAKEMSVKQVVENGFHVWAPDIPSCGKALDQNHKRHSSACMPRVKVKFPQLVGTDAKAWECTFCEQVRATKAGIDNHMTVVHREERGELRGGEAIAAALIKGLGGKTPEVASEVEDNGARMLAVLQSVGLNKSQVAALVKAGMIEEPEEVSGN